MRLTGVANMGNSLEKYTPPNRRAYRNVGAFQEQTFTMPANMAGINTINK
jgi:hypothetical protein